MNLLDLLNGYKANPRNEIRKINEILKREHYVSFTKSSFETFISLLFLKSNYVSYETTFRSFYSNLIMNGDWQDGLDEKEIAVVSYTLFCELLLNLLEIKSQGLYEYYSSFSEDIVQLKSIIQNGLKSIGYKMIKKNQAYVVEKIDLVSETVASTQKEYQDFIIEYLTSKTIVEKETALTHFSIKLEAMESNNKYIKQNREFVQLLRHKEEKKNDANYSWFFDLSQYGDNLNKLFKIFVSMVAYNDCSTYIDEFVQKTRGNSK